MNSSGLLTIVQELLSETEKMSQEIERMRELDSMAHISYMLIVTRNESQLSRTGRSSKNTQKAG